MEKYELSRLILNLSRTIIQNRNRHLEELGLTASQADCVRYFIDHDGVSIKELKVELGITHQTAQGLVSRLVEKGFLSVQQSQTDRRCQVVTTTDKGKALSVQLTANGRRTAELLVENMNDEEQEAFYRLLQVAYENVKTDGRRDEHEDTSD